MVTLAGGMVLCAVLCLVIACDKAPSAESAVSEEADAGDAQEEFRAYGVADGLPIPRWTPKPHVPKIERSLLWRVERNDRRLYLLASVDAKLDLHGAKDFPEDVREVIDESELYVAEHEGAPFMDVVKFAKLDAGESLRQMMSEHYWKMLVVQTETPEGEPRDILAGNHPWMILSMLISRVQPHPHSDPVAGSLNRYIREQEMVVEPVEGIDEHIGELRANIDIDHINLMLDRQASERRLLADVPEAYLHGDFAKLESIATDSVSMCGYAPYCRDHINARTRKWIPELVSFAGQDTTFAALPLVHFVGASGLLSEFERRGFRVERVEPVSRAGDEPAE